MAKTKPLTYPNLMDAVNAMVDAHSAIHEAVLNHGEQHHRDLIAKRQQVAVKQQAHALMTGGENK